MARFSGVAGPAESGTGTRPDEVDPILRRLLETERRRAAQLKALADTALAITAGTTPDEVVRIVTEAAREIVGTRYANVGRDDASGLPPLGDRLAAPLVGKGGSNLGILQLSDKVDGTSFTAEDRAMLVQLAQMASGAIETFELLERERLARIQAEESLAGRHRFEALVGAQKFVFEQIAQGTSLNSILETIVRLVERLSAEQVLASVLLMDEEGLRLHHAAGASLPPAYRQAVDGIEIGPAAGSFGAAASSNRWVVARDIETDRLWEELRSLALPHGLRACWSTPIPSADGRVLGTFALYYRAPGEPTADDVLLVEVFLRAAAVAIERSRDLDELVREKQVIETLHGVGQAISSRRDLEEVVQLVTDAAAALTGAQYGAFFYNAVDEEGERYRLFTLSGVQKEEFERFPTRRNTELLEPTFRGSGVVRLADVTQDPRYGRNPPHYGMPEGHLPVRSYLAVPVVAPSGEVIGGLFVGHAEAGVFTEEHERLATGIAAQAATAIEKARHYEREHQIAVTLQQSMLPGSLPELDELVLAARYVPGSRGMAVGGDWYDALRLPDGTVALSVGDVIGRGLPAATTMGQLRNAVRAYLLDGLSPAAVIDRLNRFLETISQSQFPTMVVLILDPETGSLRFANAGHLPPLIVGPDGSTRFLEGSGPALLGALDLPGAPVDRVVDLEHGSTLLLYTDGLVENRARGLEDGLATLKKIAADGATTLEHLLDRVLASLAEDEDAEDDIAVLGVRLARSHVPRLDLRLPAELGSLRTLRDDLAGWLESAGISDEEAHDLILAAWEAGINAVEHPLAPARREVRISAELKDDEVVLVVRDTGLWKEQVRSSERGRGLPLIRALVDSVSLRARSQGTEVRMRRAVRQRSAVRSRSISGAA